jgi:hypothetical protein
MICAMSMSFGPCSGDHLTGRDESTYLGNWHNLLRCQVAPGDGPDRLADVIGKLTGQDSRFHVEGGSWTSDLSWVAATTRC